MLSQLASLFCLTTIALAVTVGPVATLTVANQQVSPDGFSRAASLVNGVNPGPIIAVKKGDKLQVNVVNNLSDPNQLRSLSMHWHGVLQKGTSSMDGAVGVTQCPIAPDNSFQYVFNADIAGTYWYHSHFEVQYCDGVRGALIVYDPNDPSKDLYDVDDETTIVTLSEWYHALAPSISGIPLADATLINGHGRYPTGPSSDLAIINVVGGKRYRLRLISISCDPDFTFSIDGHNITIIEVESVNVQPYTVNTVRLLAGQRYSAVLNADQPTANYWIRALPISGNRGLNSTFTNGVNSAVLRYKDAPIADPTTTQQTYKNKLVETSLYPLSSSPAPGNPTPDGAEYVFNITMGFNPDTFRFNINGLIFIPPTVPVLLQIMSGARTAQELLPTGSVFVVERNKTHTFSVIRSADSGTFSFLNPIRRDVVNTGETEGDYTSIRFRTDNPGPWILHCHIDFHLHEGLALVFAEAPDQTVPLDPLQPAEWDQLCPTWDALPDDIKHASVVPTASV
ncbi:multicopper oxidase [Macrolepiota fuliginosa MF-IS2]|uniref:Multicopper oxidase n=1 Tax=Macrolepiota fuliginosa MF-IS2 TaxID=1400762 RepID=A0A9P5XA89_9AGAR|nr:multicopper oxidase [Macrolepiota fuliginosa MF-IS2]